MYTYSPFDGGPSPVYELYRPGTNEVVGRFSASACRKIIDGFVRTHDTPSLSATGASADLLQRWAQANNLSILVTKTDKGWECKLEGCL